MFVLTVPKAREALVLTFSIPNFLINVARFSVPRNKWVLTAKILSDTARAWAKVMSLYAYLSL